MPSRKNALDVPPNDVCLYTSDGLFIGRGSSFLHSSTLSPKSTPHTPQTWTSSLESTKRSDVEVSASEEAIAGRHTSIPPSSSSLSLHESFSSKMPTVGPPTSSVPPVRSTTDVTDDHPRASHHPHSRFPPHSGKEEHATRKGTEARENISTADGAQLVCLYRLFLSLYLSSTSSSSSSSAPGLSCAAHGTMGRSSPCGGFLSARVHLEKYNRLVREEDDDEEEEEEDEEGGGSGKWSSYYSRVEEEEEEEDERGGSAMRERGQHEKRKKTAGHSRSGGNEKKKKVQHGKEVRRKKNKCDNRLPSPHPSFLSSLYLLPAQPPVTPLLSSAASAAAATLPHVFFPEYLEPSGVLEQHVVDHLIHDPPPSFDASSPTSKMAFASHSDVTPPLPTFASSSITTAPMRFAPSELLTLNTNRSANGLDELPLRLGLGLPFQCEVGETGGAEAPSSLLPSSSFSVVAVDAAEDGEEEEIQKETKRNASGKTKANKHRSTREEEDTPLCSVAKLTVETSAHRFTCTLRSLLESPISTDPCASMPSRPRRPLWESISGSSRTLRVSSPECRMSAEEAWEEEGRPDDEEEEDEEGGEEKDQTHLRFGEPLVFCCTGKKKNGKWWWVNERNRLCFVIGVSLGIRAQTYRKRHLYASIDTRKRDECIVYCIYFFFLPSNEIVFCDGWVLW